jgi:hypothetical protein
MLPNKLRFALFDHLSLKTMRHVHAVPNRDAEGLVRHVYDMIADDFFLNGSLTSHSGVPELLAGVWTGGRETVLVDDKLDRTTKEAMTATLSRINDCPYCGDMLISLVHSGGDHQAASEIYAESEENIHDITLRNRLAWVKAVAGPDVDDVVYNPFTADQLPEAIGSLMAMSHINRFSHVVMDGSPVNAPLGIKGIKAAALRLFGAELKPTKRRLLKPGRSLDLLPPAPLPEDLAWARPNPRIADALARWAGVVTRETDGVISHEVKAVVHASLQNWHGEVMPISRSWVEQELAGLTGQERAVARLALVVAKAPYQVDDSLVEPVLGAERDEQRFIRVLDWCAFTAARRIAQRIANSSGQSLRQQKLVA